MGRRPAELGIEVGDEVFAQVPIGAGDGGDAGHAQLIDEPALQRAIGALAATARLRRIPEDVLDAEAGQGAADLGKPAAAGRRRRRGYAPPSGHGRCTAPWAGRGAGARRAGPASRPARFRPGTELA